MATSSVPLLGEGGSQGAKGLRGRVLLVSIASACALAVLYSRLPYGGAKTELYQIGDQEYLPMPSGSAEDMALDVEREMAKEKILLTKIATRARKHKRVLIDVEAGQIGKRGRPGRTGFPGPKGFQGARGERGDMGPQGPRGDTGPKGIKGIKGEDGDQGRSGLKGKQGPPGPPGPRGRRGRAGLRGPEGPIGKAGLQGAKGENGLMGPEGEAATGDGIKGNRGDPGKKGPPGDPGDPGRGGDMGPRGDQGANGAPGAPGARGEAGRPGKSKCGLATNIGKSVCCGEVNHNSFKKIGRYTFQADIDTTRCAFTGAPKYFTTLQQNGYGANVYNLGAIQPTTNKKNRIGKQNFRVVVRVDRHVNHISTIRHYKWKLQWCGIGDSDRPTPFNYAMCCGSSKIGGWSTTASWQGYDDISISGCGWQNGAKGLGSKPYIFTSMSDNTCGKGLMNSGQCPGKAAMSYNSIYHTSNKHFRVYIQRYPGLPNINGHTANKYGWQIKWCAIKPLPPTNDGAAGYPCTAPRVLAGNNRQSIMSNNANICCDTSTSRGWRSAGDGQTLYKDIDTTQCQFKKVQYVLTDIRGDRGSGVDTLHGQTAYAYRGKDTNKMRVYVWTKGRYKFFNAQTNHWKIQWCAVGF